MAEILNDIDSVLRELSRLWCRDDPSFHPQIMKLEDDLRFLSAVGTCIQYSNTADEAFGFQVDLHVSIAFAMRNISKEIRKMTKLSPDSVAFGERAGNCSDVLTTMMKTLSLSKRRRALTKWLDLYFDKLNSWIYVLKGSVREFCEASIGVGRLKFCFSLKKDKRLKASAFVPSIASHLEYFKRKFDFGNAWKERIEAIEDILFLFAQYFDSENRHYRDFRNFKIDIGTEAIGATLLYCQWWAMEFNPNMKQDMLMALEFLQQKTISRSEGNFTGRILQLLKTLRSLRDHTLHQDDENQTINVFVDRLLLFKEKFKECPVSERLDTLGRELKSLLTSFVETEHQRFFKEVKEVVEEVRTLKYSLQIVDEEGIGNTLQDLIAKVWLLNIEIFLLARQTDVSILLLSMEEQSNDLIQGADQIKKSPEEHTESVNKILMLREEVAKAVASLGNFHSSNVSNKVVRNVRRLLLLNMLLFTMHLKLNDNNESLVVSIRSQIQSFHEALKFLKTSVVDKPDGNVMVGKLEFTNIKAATRRVFSLCHLFLTGDITEEMLKKINLFLADLLDEIKLIMARLKEIYLHAPKSKFPKTNAMGFFETFLSTLRELLNYKADLVVPVMQPIEEISGHLEFFRPFLWDILGKDNDDQELKNLGARVIDVAYEVECLIDSILGQTETECHNMIWLYHLLQDVRLLKIHASEVHEKKTYEMPYVPQTSRHMISKATRPIMDEPMVGLNDQEEVMIDQLLGGLPSRDVVSIVGMAGIGKTALAKKVYNSSGIVRHFHIRAWACVSETYRKRDLLLEILKQITAITDEILEMTDEDLDFRLYQLLKQKKYLIVLDDIWNTEVWDDLGRSFPNDENWSRVMVTSRFLHVALKAKTHTDPHPLRLLSDAESWDLLQMKVFHEEKCPAELMDIGVQIAKSCKGLPLAIVAVAGLLGRIDRQQNCWKEIAEDLSSRILDDPQEQCRKILELSYKHLPGHLKACFLYFGAFHEDENIPVKKLIRLWIAEGFVQKTELQSLEDIAEDYLMDLIGRSMVVFSQRRSRGGIKTCCIHDMLRSLCKSKAKEEKFLHVITRFDGSNDSFDDLDYTVDINYTNPPNSATYEDHRLCFCSKRKHFVESRPLGPRVRSLLFFAANDMYPRCPYDISFISHNFKFLKVLDLESLNMGTSFPDGIEILVHLRYLAATGDIDSVPPLIGNLWKLETFVVNGLKGKVKLPDTIWCLARLRHVQVSDLAVFSLHDGILQNSTKLENLITLSSPYLLYGQDTTCILRQFPNLQKLRCIFSESLIDSQQCNQFPDLNVLNQLESLKISYYGKNFFPGVFNFPVNLKKLTLSNFRMPWSHISVIGSLPNLEVLKLISRAFEGETWNMIEGEFSELKYLKLDTLNIAKWEASSDHFPKLQQLVVRRCNHLEEIPTSFVEITTLQMIEVQWCGDSVEKSVRKLQDEAVEGLKIIINLSYVDSRSSN